MPGLDTPLRAVVGGTAAKLESSLGLRTVGDLLRHYPRRYQERGELTPFADLRPGEEVTVFAEVHRCSGRSLVSRAGKRLHKTDVVVRDDGGRTLALTFFNQVWREKELRVGRRAFFAGKVEVFAGRTQLTNPQVQLVDDETGAADSDFAAAVIPVYPATKDVSTFVLGKAVRVALDVVDELPDPLPEELRTARGLPPLRDAYRLVHRPESRADWTRGQERLKWDEALVLQVTLAQRRAAAAAGTPAVPRRPTVGGLLDRFDAAMPFALTAGQAEVGATLAAELQAATPMHRLLQGEVGSGKTVVALRAMLQVVDAGGQAALLAPTEVLAAQHARSLRLLLGPLAEGGLLGGAADGTRVALLTGSLTARQRREALLQAASGEAGIVVGTHALLSEGVQFADLGLVVVDEQHRFGVEQRDALRAKAAGAPPHVLVMTATPIPRTVAMTVYGDLETSVLRELPRGRSPIATSVVPVAEKPGWLDRAWQRVREEVAAGRQAYVVCPRIGEGPQAEDEADEAPPDEEEGARRPGAAVLDVLPLLAEGPLAGLRVEALHGRLSPDDKDAVMARFSAGDTDVLVATTVVEVGVDVPNATVMVVVDADRFGISQLHQLRGRVGRGQHPSLCLLVTEAPEGTAARERLDAVAGTLDGFALARVDLEQRREGDVLGAAQSGRRGHLRLLSLLRDEDVIVEARAAATALVAADPGLAEHPALAAAIRDALDEERAGYLEKG